jgi:uncharacterized membrane protein
MDPITALKTLHIAAIGLFLLCALGLVGWLVKGRGEDVARHHARLLSAPRLFAWLLMGMCLLIMPISGWWLAHLAGLPLGEIWVLASSVLYTLGALSWLWLVARLNRMRIDNSHGNLKITLGFAIFSAVCFIAIAGLLGVRPV